MKNRVKTWLLLLSILVVSALVTVYLLSGIPDSAAVRKSSNEPGGAGKTTKIKTLVFYFGGNDPSGSIKATTDAFKKAYPGIDVKVKQLPNSTDYQRNYYKRALYSGDSSIDVFFSDIIWTAELASSGWVLPLGSYFDASVQEEFLQNALEGCKYDGKLFAIPARTDIPLLFYRSDIIKSPPATYKEMIDLSKQFKESNGLKYGYVFQGQAYEGLVCTALEFIWNNGGDVMKDGKVVIDSPEAIGGLQALADIMDSGVASTDVFNFQEEDARIAFQDGNSLFMRNWPYVYNQLASNNSKVKGRFNIAPLPLGPKGKISRGTLGGWNLMINRNTKNLEEALEFVKFMSSHEIEVLDCSTGGYLPARKAAYDDPGVRKANPWIIGFMSAFENANLRTVSPSYSSISSCMQTNFSGCIQGRLSPEEAVENIEKALLAMDLTGKK